VPRWHCTRGLATADAGQLEAAQIETALIEPGSSWQNGADESFNGKFRDEHLSLQWFRNRIDARVGIEQWRRHYNEVRPHSSLGYLTPVKFKATLCKGAWRPEVTRRKRAAKSSNISCYPM